MPLDQPTTLWDPAIDEVRRDLLDAAVSCFASQGYHATRTRDISVGAGLSPAAMYVHFASKELLLYEIVRTAHLRALADIEDPAIQAASTAGGELAQVVSRYTAWHARHHDAARIAHYELSGLTPEHHAEILTLLEATDDVYRRAVGRGVEDGSFADVAVVPVARAMRSLSVDLSRWYRPGEGYSPEEVGELYGELALKMVLS